MHRRAPVILIVAFALAGGPRPAVACSCPLFPQDSYASRVPRTITVHTVANGASCGYTFEVGKRYTVFPWSQSGKLDAGLCRGNVEGTIVAAQYGLPEGRPPRN